MDQTVHFKLASSCPLSEISFALFQAVELPQDFFFFLHSTCAGDLLGSYTFPSKSCCNMHQKGPKECSERMGDSMAMQGWMKSIS